MLNNEAITKPVDFLVHFFFCTHLQQNLLRNSFKGVRLYSRWKTACENISVFEFMVFIFWLFTSVGIEVCTHWPLYYFIRPQKRICEWQWQLTLVGHMSVTTWRIQYVQTTFILYRTFYFNSHKTNTHSKSTLHWLIWKLSCTDTDIYFCKCSFTVKLKFSVNDSIK